MACAVCQRARQVIKAAGRKLLPPAKKVSK